MTATAGVRLVVSHALGAAAISLPRPVLLAGAMAALLAGQLVAAVVVAALAVAVSTPAYPASAAALPGLAGRRTGRLTDLLVTVEVAAFVVGPAMGGVLLGAGDQGFGVGTAALGFGALAAPLLGYPLRMRAALAVSAAGPVLAAMLGALVAPWLATVLGPVALFVTVALVLAMVAVGWAPGVSGRRAVGLAVVADDPADVHAVQHQ